jgi:hypothetical protein
MQLMTISNEIDKIRDAIREVEDPSAAMALRHVYKALEELRDELVGLKGTPDTMGKEQETLPRH